MNRWFKYNGIHLAMVGFFFALCLLYFSAAWQKKSLVQQDVIQAQAMAKELMTYKEKDGKAPLWTNAMFGGMPAYQIWVPYPSNVTTYIVGFFKTIFPNPVDLVFLYLLGAYFLFSVLQIRPWLAAAGAIAFAFSSYNFIIIEAGHNNKAMAIAFFAPVLAGILLTLRGKYSLGAALTALFLSLEIRSNHIQMTYYLFIALSLFIAIEFFYAIRSKTSSHFFKSCAYLLCAVFLAVTVNAGMLWTTYEYGQESLRGKSNLTNHEAKINDGLDKEYAYQWSQGLGEIITFIVPNAYGGSSVSSANEDSEVVKVLHEYGVDGYHALGFAKQLPSYWGGKPGTSGPWYFGSVICLLFIFGCFVVQDRLKWWILAATTLSLFLSFGKNFPLVSDFFFDYFPLYNKFRAVESTLVIAALVVPILAILAIKEASFLLIDPKILLKKLLHSLYITGGLLFSLIIAPKLFFDFRAPDHEGFIKRLIQVTNDNPTLAHGIANALVEDRVHMAQVDAIRSSLFILLAAALISALIKKKIGTGLCYIVLGLMILVDLWSIDRRYLNNENFVDKDVIQQESQAREVDQRILQDTSLNYRVFDLSISTFSSASASYFHKTIGGYHAAKLKRFQEILDKQFSHAINEDVLDMLNTKYVIYNDQKTKSQQVQLRKIACGNAWIVQHLRFVKGADEEMSSINSFDPKTVAFVDSKFKALIDEKKIKFDPNAKIQLVHYRPDHLVYEYSATTDVVAIFSEIWYDRGWNAYVDGQKIPHFRANYILRAAELPAGAHQIAFKFEPMSYYYGEKISLIASIILILTLIFVIYREIKIKT